MTLLALISDVHGNRHALEAVLETLDRRSVDAILCAGDMIGFGPDPNGCVDLLRSAAVRCVAGNHELIALGLRGDQRCGPRARASQHWTQGILRPDVRGWLAQLPLRLEADGMVITHGSLDDVEEYIRSDAQAQRQLQRLEDVAPDARMLVLGHTHHARIVREASGTVTRRPHTPVSFASSRLLVNPGSVGQSRQLERRPRARLALVDTATHHVELEAVDYDVDACRAALARLGLPVENVHLRPARLRHLGSRARRVLRARRAEHPEVAS